MANPDAQQSLRPLFFGLARYVAAQVLVALSTLVAIWIASLWGDAAVEMIYLPAVLAAGAWWGFGPGVLAAVSSALAYNFFFTEPVYTLRITSAVDVVNVSILFLAALVTSQLASAIRKQAQIANAYAARNATIAGFARRLLSCGNESEIAQAACAELSHLFGCNAVVMAGLPRPATIAAVPDVVSLSPTDLAAAVHTLQSGEISGHGSSRLSAAEWNFHAIRSDGSPLAVMGVSRDDGFIVVPDVHKQLLESLLDQTALALAGMRTRGDPPANLAVVPNRARRSGVQG